MNLGHTLTGGSTDLLVSTPCRTSACADLRQSTRAKCRSICRPRRGPRFEEVKQPFLDFGELLGIDPSPMRGDGIQHIRMLTQAGQDHQIDNRSQWIQGFGCQLTGKLEFVRRLTQAMDRERSITAFVSATAGWLTNSSRMPCADLHAKGHAQQMPHPGCAFQFGRQVVIELPRDGRHVDGHARTWIIITLYR